MSTKNNHVKIKTWLMEDKRRTKLIRIQNPGGHKEGRASFPIQSQYKVSNLHGSNPTLEKKEKKNREEKGERRLVKGGGGYSWCPGQERDREGEGVFVVPTQGSKIRLDLN